MPEGDSNTRYWRVQRTRPSIVASPGVEGRINSRWDALLGCWCCALVLLLALLLLLLLLAQPGERARARTAAVREGCGGEGSDGEGGGRGECGDGEDGVAERAARESERGRQRREGSGGGGDGAEGERGGRQSRAAERAAWRAVALGGEGAAGEVRLPQADGSNGAEEKRKRRQKRLSFSLELIEHYGKKSLFCKRPPNPLCGARNAARARDLCSGKTKRDFFLFLAALNSVRAGLPRWPMRCIRPWSPE